MQCFDRMFHSFGWIINLSSYLYFNHETLAERCEMTTGHVNSSGIREYTAIALILSIIGVLFPGCYKAQTGTRTQLFRRLKLYKHAWDRCRSSNG